MNSKNLAPENIEGTYTLNIVGKTITITDSSGHTKTANCAPDDTFNLGEGVNLAMSRLHDKNLAMSRLHDKNLAMSRLHDKTIRVGDIVKVTRPGQCYTTYVSWIERNVKSIREAALYRYNESIEAGGEYRVLYMAEHGHSFDDGILCYVQKYVVYPGGEIDELAPCYLINIKGVEKI